MHEGGEAKPWDHVSVTGGKSRSNPGQGDVMRRASGVVVRQTCVCPRLKLKRSTRVGASNIMSLSEVRDKRPDET